MLFRPFICAVSLVSSVLFFSKKIDAQGLTFIEESEQHFVDRLHTLYGHNGDSFQVNTPLSSMADAFNLYNYYKSDVYNGILSNKDVYRLNQYLLYNSDLSSYVKNPLISTPEFSGFAGLYKNTPYLLESKGQVNFLLQPILAQTAIANFDQNESLFYNQSYAGLYSRLTVGRRFGLQAKVYYKTENLLKHYEQSALEYNAVPDNFNRIDQPFQDGDKVMINDIVPTFQMSYDIIPSHLTISAGLDQIFIGEGIRSLIMDHHSGPMPYMALKTKIWKFDYTNIFLKPNSQNIFMTLPQSGQNKYVSLHYLSMNIGKRVNVGIFETITSSREGGPELSYFNPVMFYRALERHLGSPDKMALGATGSAVLAKGVKLYGQIFINEFVVKELMAGDGYIHNKWGTQVGLKYYDVAKIDNLDAQLEVNVVRPYAYQHRSNANFSHNNLPIAHPLGANFKEYLFHVSYMPHVKYQIKGRIHYYSKGLNINGINYGGNILQDIRTAPNRYGVHIGQGFGQNVLMADASIKYEVLPFMYLELGAMYRQSKYDNNSNNGHDVYGFASFQFHLNKRDQMIF